MAATRAQRLKLGKGSSALREPTGVAALREDVPAYVVLAGGATVSIDGDAVNGEQLDPLEVGPGGRHAAARRQHAVGRKVGQLARRVYHRAAVAHVAVYHEGDVVKSCPLARRDEPGKSEVRVGGAIRRGQSPAGVLPVAESFGDAARGERLQRGVRVRRDVVDLARDWLEARPSSVSRPASVAISR